MYPDPVYPDPVYPDLVHPASCVLAAINLRGLKENHISSSVSVLLLPLANNYTLLTLVCQALVY